ncbi:glycosyltransferase family 39 protein [Vallitalea pronyensis]|uniref:Polyprenol-phosphate-mannose--protein mannosyltransferase n=1 Tax=Vallitalea pronyensis TaxID=1348613 RepID=A0A8J8SG85_9FIRM|nr:glycosyltransferase family 39 protein [Vallitalea pronyensis]QUI22495.1 glycosyltransferase family 39 protein [Vallitalea pronyensis]
MNCFKAWSTHAAKSLSHFYTSDLFTDYPPGYIYILWCIGKLKDMFGLSSDATALLYLIKMPAVLADVISVYILYWVASRHMHTRRALGLAVLYAMNPAVLVNSAIWGQVDAIFTLMLVVSLYEMYQHRFRRGTVWYVLAVLFKPQALIIAPLYLFIFIDKRSWRCLWQSLVIGLAVFVLLILPFSMGQHPLWIVDQYLNTLGSYPYASLNAWNLFTLFGGNWAPIQDTFVWLSYEIWGYVFLIGAVTVSCIMYVKQRDRVKIFYIAAFIYLAFFVTGIKMHERYLFPVLILTLFSYIYTHKKAYYHIFCVLSVTHFINVAFVLYLGSYMGGILYIISAVHVIVWIGFMMMIYPQKWHGIYAVMLKLSEGVKKIGHSRQLTTVALNKPMASNKQPTSSKQSKMTVQDWVIVICIMLVYGCVAFFNLGDRTAPQTFYRTHHDNGAFYLDFGEVAYIDSMTCYTGADIGGTLHIQLSMDGEEWTGVGDMTHNSVFLWQKIQIGKEARYVKCLPRGLSVIGEVAFFGKNSPIPLTIHQVVAMEQHYQEEVINVKDEQNMAVAIPSYKNSSYFDEIYFARSGYEYLNHKPIYEYTHPPLGKLLISVGIALFDMTPFGWRFAGTVIGIFMVGIMYLLGKGLFGQTKYAVLAALIMALDGVHFVQTRIATVDGFLVCFIMLMYYFMYRYTQQLKYSTSLTHTLKPLFLSGFFFGLGVATKWSALYAGIGLAIIYFYVLMKKNCMLNASHKKAKGFFIQWILWACGCFIIIPATVYVLTYVPQLQIEGSRIRHLWDVLRLQKDMFHYHQQLVSHHPFASEPWTWPWLIKPVWYYMGRYGLAEGTKSSIVLMGNPIIWWSGIVAAGYTLYDTIRTKRKVGMFLLVAFFAQYVPCFFIPRQMFLYHYFPSLVFIMLMIVYGFSRLEEKSWGSRKTNLVMMIYGVIILITFVLFYPILSGSTFTQAFAEVWLRWMDTWIFI